MPDNETTTTTTTSESAIERRKLLHYIDASFNGSTPNYYRIGKDLEEYVINMNPEEETKRNIWGESSTRVKGYEPESSVETYYAVEGDALFAKLYDIVNSRATGTDLETTVVDVLVASDNSNTAYKENVIVIPQSIGGGTEGVQIPYTIKYNGNRVAGTFNPTTRAFTASSS